MSSQNTETKESTASSHVHTGHRERTKKKILKQGFDGLYDHELLELLLFYAVPRRDTNPIAHELLERFGSLRELMEADVDAIAGASGIGTSAALLIKATMEMSRRYIRSDTDPIVYYDSVIKVISYAKNLYVGCVKEISYALLFDNKMKLVDQVMIGEGIVNVTPIHFRRLAEAVFRKNASAVILVHNHPGGNSLPSREDTIATRQVYDFLRTISVPLLEHLVISGAEAYPLMYYSAQYDLNQITSEYFGEDFYLKFYVAPNSFRKAGEGFDVSKSRR